MYGHTHLYFIGLVDRVGGVQGRTPEVSIYRFFILWVFKTGCSPGCQCSISIPNTVKRSEDSHCSLYRPLFDPFVFNAAP